MRLILAVLTFGLMIQNAAMADMDPASRDLLIDKLTKVNLSLPPNDTSKVAVTLRLADLLAERARLSAMKDLEGGCTVCTAGKVDREKAIRMYREVQDKVPAASQGKVMIQLGHLYEVTGQDAEAQNFYSRILRQENADPAMRAEAHLSLAEMAFKKNQWAKARDEYNEVLKIPTANSRGLAAYRSSWCAYHLGDVNVACQGLETVLKTPALLTRSGVGEGQVDAQFQEEVSRDLATFMAKKNLEQSDIEKLYELSPASTKISNVTSLASQAEQVGRKKEALIVWNFVVDRQAQPADRLEALLHRSALRLETSEREKSLQDLESATGLWKEMKGCGRADCTETQKSFRQYLIVWNKAEKKAPTPELSRAYGYYLEIFPQDAEMQVWGAEVARNLKDWGTSDARTKAALNAYKKDKAAGKTQDVAAINDKIETALLTHIEMAEASKDDALLASAQDLYLAESSKQTKRFEVQYQKAHRLYEANQMALAADAMKTLALDKQGPANLRKQAADLSLDALGILKDDDKIISWSKEYANVFKGQSGDFRQVEQKAVLTKSAKVAASSPAEALAALGSFDSANASAEDRILYLKNREILAEKTGQFNVAANAADELLALKDLKAEDREFALSRKAWLAEMRLDFSTAYKTTEQMSLKDLTSDQKTLKLALYADLSGQNPVPLYQQFLKTSKDDESKQAVASEIVRRSSDPGSAIETQKLILEKSPDLLGRLYTEAYAKTSSDKILSKASGEIKIQKTDWGRLLQRLALLKEFNTVKDKLTAMKLDSKTQKTLSKSIKDRAAELANLEKMAGRAINSGDWTSQLVTIDLVGRESERFYGELMSLPMPEGLKPDEESQYMNLLGQQAQPFKAKAEQAQQKTKEFWANPNWKADLEKSAKDSSQFQGLFKTEVASLQAAAPADQQDFFKNLMSSHSEIATGPDLKTIEAARDEVRRQPQDRAGVQKLLDLEKQARNFAMVQYLEGRLRAMPTGGVQ